MATFTAATADASRSRTAFAASGDPAVDALPTGLRSVDPESCAACCDVLADVDLRPGPYHRTDPCRRGPRRKSHAAA
ncbi:hypothetical protein [Streptomyces lunaelactis]|uniref:hypothetical protein n=1 Tax=Streptomyces lunaelactis TaxID=1535768 RepID=UPI001584F7FB|nr:hypothetical protein [Streptomyces lunaelactis]NUK13739.1 hypothetical protein [Streptomyces lunaelactis]